MANIARDPSPATTPASSAPAAESSTPGASPVSQSPHAVSVGNPADNPLGAVQTRPARERLPFELASQIIRDASQSSSSAPVAALSKVLNLRQEDVITALPTSEQRLNGITNSVAFAKDPVAQMAKFTQVNADGRREIDPTFRLDGRHANQADTLANAPLQVVKDFGANADSMDRLHLGMELSDSFPRNNAARSALAVGLSRRLRELQSSPRLQNEAIDMVRNSITTTPTPSGMRLSALAAMLGAVGDMQSIETQRKVLEAATAASHQVPQNSRQIETVNGVQREIQLSPIPSEKERVELAILLGKAIPDFHSSPTNSGDNMQHKAYKLFRNMLRDGDLSGISSAMQPVQMTPFSNAGKAKIIQAVAGSLPAQPSSFRPGAKVIPPRPPIRTALVREMTKALDNIDAQGSGLEKLASAADNVPGWSGLLTAVAGLDKDNQRTILSAFLTQMKVNVAQLTEEQFNVEMIGRVAQRVQRRAEGVADGIAQMESLSNLPLLDPAQAALAAQAAQAAPPVRAQADQAVQLVAAAQEHAAQAVREADPALTAQAVREAERAESAAARAQYVVTDVLARINGAPAPEAFEQLHYLGLQESKEEFIPCYQALADALPSIKDTALRSNLSAHLDEFNQALPEAQKIKPSQTSQG